MHQLPRPPLQTLAAVDDGVWSNDGRPLQARQARPPLQTPDDGVRSNDGRPLQARQASGGIPHRTLQRMFLI
jgi:hypothetical protein